MKTAVTAASGQLGAAIVKQLVADVSSDQIVGIARTPENARNLGVEIRAGDYDDRIGLERALDGVDALVLVSANGDPRGRVGQHRNVIDAAKSADVRKIIYTSIGGPEEDTSFSPIVASNRQTERDIHDSGLQWSVGRNGLYIEPDVEYIDHYIKAGKISNCAGKGLCSYTTRAELAYAYAQMVLNDDHNGKTYRLAGEPITQSQLTELFNNHFGTNLVYQARTVEDYKAERIAELGEFMGTVITGIYQGIRNGGFAFDSDYQDAAGRPHVAWANYFAQAARRRPK